MASADAQKPRTATRRTPTARRTYPAASPLVHHGPAPRGPCARDDSPRRSDAECERGDSLCVRERASTVRADGENAIECSGRARLEGLEKTGRPTTAAPMPTDDRRKAPSSPGRRSGRGVVGSSRPSTASRLPPATHDVAPPIRLPVSAKTLAMKTPSHGGNEATGGERELILCVSRSEHRPSTARGSDWFQRPRPCRWAGSQAQGGTWPEQSACHRSTRASVMLGARHMPTSVTRPTTRPTRARE